MISNVIEILWIYPVIMYDLSLLQEGFNAIPESWRERTHRYEEVLGLTLQLIKIEL